MNKKQQDRLEVIVEKMVATAATDLLLQVCAFLCKKADIPLEFITVEDGQHVAVQTGQTEPN